MQRWFEALGVGRDEVLVVPFLLDHIGQQAVEQRDIRTRLDIQVQHVVLARRLFGHGNRGGAARVDEDHLRRSNALAGKALLALVDRLPLQVG
ncbi:hypothetical protein D9M71_707760 [compost metagenome]